MSESNPELDVLRYDRRRPKSPVYKGQQSTAAAVSQPIEAQAEQNKKCLAKSP